MAQMQQSRLIPDEFNGLLLAATFCSMLLTPLLLRAAPAIALRLHRKPNQQVQLEHITALNAQLHRHVVICGYGRVGQSIGRFMRREQQAFIALDDDPNGCRKPPPRTAACITATAAVALCSAPSAWNGRGWW